MRLSAILCKCIYTCQDLLFTRVCNHQAPMHCSTVQGKMHALLFCVAVQNRLTAVLCHCIHNYQDLLSTQVLQTPNTNALQHCSGQNACLVVLCRCAKQADSSLVPLHLHLSRFTLHTGVQPPGISACHLCTYVLLLCKHCTLYCIPFRFDIT